MDQTGYEVLYDYRYDWAAIVIPVGCIAVPLVIAALGGRRLWRWLPTQPGGDIVIAVVALSAFLGLFLRLGVGGLIARQQVLGLLDRGEVRVVEGVVTDFKPIPPQGKASEHWKVNGVDFAVIQQEAGHVSGGMRVRVSYLEDPHCRDIDPGYCRGVLRIEAAPGGE